MVNMNLYSKGDRAFVILNMILIGIFTLSALYLFIYIASLSLSAGFEARLGNVILTPVGFALEAFSRVLSERLFSVFYGNTPVYAIFGTLMTPAFIIPGAYALSRKQLYGRRFWNLMVAFTMWFHAGMTRFFLNIRDLDLLDSYFDIIIGSAVNGFNLILLRNFFEGIAESFEKAARMDGANGFQVLWQVYLPLSKPGIATFSLFCIVSRWNGLFWGMVLLEDEEKIPLQVYLRHVHY